MNVAGFNAQLRRMGQDVLWTKASRCPCTTDKTSGSPSYTCKVCRGRGYFWAPSVASRTGLSGMSVQREWAKFGQFESGDVVVSIGSDQPLYAAAEMDRVLFSQSSESFDMVRFRGDALEFSIMAPLPVLLDAGTVSAQSTVPNAPFQVITFERCFWVTPAKDAVIEGGLPVQAADGSLSWPNGGAPPDGTAYTLQGRRIPEYFVFGPFARDRAHFGGQALPRRVVLRKWDLFSK